MGNRAFYPAAGYGINRIYAEFELLGAGAAALTFGTAQGANNIVSLVTRSSAGIFVVTLKDAYNRVICKTADADDTLNDGAYVTLSDVTNEATALPIVFTLRFRNAAGTLADPASGRRIGVSIAFRNGLPNQGG